MTTHKTEAMTAEPTAHTLHEVTPETLHVSDMVEVQPTGASHHTRQMATDTTVEEREVLLQRAMTVNTVHDARAVYDQIEEHRKMYQGDEALGMFDAAMARLEKMVA